VDVVTVKSTVGSLIPVALSQFDKDLVAAVLIT